MAVPCAGAWVCLRPPRRVRCSSSARGEGEWGRDTGHARREHSPARWQTFASPRRPEPSEGRFCGSAGRGDVPCECAALAARAIANDGDPGCQEQVSGRRVRDSTDKATYRRIGSSARRRALTARVRSNGRTSRATTRDRPCRAMSRASTPKWDEPRRGSTQGRRQCRLVRDTQVRKCKLYDAI